MIRAVSESKILCVLANSKLLAPNPSLAPFSFEIVVPVVFRGLISNDISEVFAGLIDGQVGKIGLLLRDVTFEFGDSELLIRGNPSTSEYISPSISDWQEIDVPEKALAAATLVGFQLEEPEISLLNERLRSRWRISFGEIPTRIVSKALESAPRFAASLTSLASVVETTLRSNFATSDLHMTPSDRQTSTPFSSAATLLASFFAQRSQVEIEPSRIRMPNVDLALRPSTIQDFVARSRTGATIPSVFDIDAANQKIERAELKHQEILADCATYLRDLGITPLSSASADLAFTFGTNLHLYEIKSATSDNFNAQFEKGLLQIARYRWEFAPHFSPIRPCLVIEKPEGISIPDMYFDFADSLGVVLLLWDEAKPWPDRIDNFVRHNFELLEE